MHSATIYAHKLLAEAAQYLPGTPDHEYRLDAAWRLIQIGAGVCITEWTDRPDDFGPYYLTGGMAA